MVAQNWQLLKQAGDPASQRLIEMLQDLDAEVQEGGGGSQPILVSRDYTLADVILDDGSGVAYMSPSLVTLNDGDVLFSCGVVVTEDFNDTQVGGLYPTLYPDVLASTTPLSSGSPPTVTPPTSGLLVLHDPTTAPNTPSTQLPAVVVPPGSGPVIVSVLMSTGSQWDGDGTTGALTAYALVARA